ncbi:hypothetical protein [Tunicatimonas pelagia]|uniref:hypothetical protein n=1 Tax=Tunicatimonas pelagia TaxID=931531 RepID=UPI0026657CB3|nr:hypothetical protein [Tunicatimonas pelagia]WKN40819.1 hypothetical protein P0M28_17420 [Tunicatimonas pelagia]
MKYLILFTASFLLFACEENDPVLPDDNNQGNNPEPQPVVSNDLTGEWQVDLFKDDNEDETSDFAGLTFTFQENGDLVIAEEQQNTTAAWSINGAGNRVEIDLSTENLQAFSNRSELEDLDDDDWMVIEKNDTLIHLLEVDDDNTLDEVRFVKSTSASDGSDTGNPNPEPQPVVTEDLTGDWQVGLFKDDNEDETTDFDGLTFTFRDNGELLIADSQQSTTAAWSINAAGNRVAIDLSSENLQTFSNREELEDLDDDDWMVIEKSDSLIHLLEEDDDGTRDEVRFVRATGSSRNLNTTPQPEANQGATNGWQVTLFRDDGKEDTNSFNGLVFTFQENGKLVIADDQKSTVAEWSINEAGDQVRINLSAGNLQAFSDRGELSDLDDDNWIVLERTNAVFHLRESGNNTLDEFRFERQ